MNTQKKKEAKKETKKVLVKKTATTRDAAQAVGLIMK